MLSKTFRKSKASIKNVLVKEYQSHVQNITSFMNTSKLEKKPNLNLIVLQQSQRYYHLKWQSPFQKN
jgi:hypothetical protein